MNLQAQLERKRLLEKCEVVARQKIKTLEALLDAIKAEKSLIDLQTAKARWELGETPYYIGQLITIKQGYDNEYRPLSSMDGRQFEIHSLGDDSCRVIAVIGSAYVPFTFIETPARSEVS